MQTEEDSSNDSLNKVKDELSTMKDQINELFNEQGKVSQDIKKNQIDSDGANKLNDEVNSLKEEVKNIKDLLLDQQKIDHVKNGEQQEQSAEPISSDIIERLENVEKMQKELALKLQGMPNEQQITQSTSGEPINKELKEIQDKVKFLEKIGGGLSIGIMNPPPDEMTEMVKEVREKYNNTIKIIDNFHSEVRCIKHELLSLKNKSGSNYATKDTEPISDSQISDYIKGIKFNEKSIK